MPRVIRPDGTGAQRLGSVQPIAASTPFQTLRAPDLGDGGVGKGAKALGAAITQGAALYNEVRVDNEKRELLKFDAAEGALRNQLLSDPENGLMAQSGQSALDMLTGAPGGAGGGGRPQKDGLSTKYKTELDKLRERYGTSMGTRGKETLNLRGQNLTTSFSGLVNGAQIKAQSIVDAQITGDRIATAVNSAVSGAGTPAGETELKAALGVVETTVLDPDIGMAQAKGITDAKGKERLVRDQKALVYEGVIKELIAQGDTVKALELLQQETAEGGALEGTTVGTALQSQLATVRDGLKGKQLFSKYSTSHPNDPSGQLREILKITDPTDQSLVLTEFKARNSLNNLVKREQIGKETLALVRFMSDNPGVPIDPTAYPALAQFSSRLVYEASGKVASQANRAMMDAGTRQHINSGGSAVGNVMAVGQLKRMADSRETRDQFLELMKNPDNIKKFTNSGQWAELLSKQAAATNAKADALTGTIKYDSLLVELGFSKTSANYKSLLYDTELGASLTAERMRIWKAEGRKATLEDLRPIIARQTLGFDKELSVSPTIYTLSEHAKAGADHLDINEAPLDYDEKSSWLRLHYVFEGEVSKDDIEKIVDELDNTNDKITLNMIADAIKKKYPAVEAMDMINLPLAERRAAEFDDDALSMGYPPDFIEAVLGIDSTPHTSSALNNLNDRFQRQPALYKELFEKWSTGEIR